MIIKTLLCFTMIIGLCFCSNEILLKEGSINLNITTKDDTVNTENPNVEVNVCFSNTSHYPLSVLYLNDFSFDSSSLFTVEVEKDNIRKMSSDIYLQKRRKPNKSDYKDLKFGDSVCLTYVLNISSLINEHEELGKTNYDYGTYTISLKFLDRYLIRDNALRECRSNKIKVLYRK